MSKNSRLVYSTDSGRIKPEPEKASSAAGQSDGTVRLSRESKGRGGKPVTLVIGLGLEGSELKALAKKMKQLCGVGGTVKDGVVEIQGEQRDKLKPFLEAQGFSVKIAGG